jgi:hypothetical protein
LFSAVLGGCITLPGTFVADGNTLVHKPTGVRYPKKITAWNLMEGATDRVDDAISATASYQRSSFAKAISGDFVPYATVYVLSSKEIDGIGLLEKRLKKLSPHAVFEGTRKIKTQMGTATASVYGHAAAVSLAPLVAQEVKAESWLIQYPGRQLAFWVTIDKGQSDERSAPADFVNRFAEAIPL